MERKRKGGLGLNACRAESFLAMSGHQLLLPHNLPKLYFGARHCKLYLLFESAGESLYRMSFAYSVPFSPS